MSWNELAYMGLTVRPFDGSKPAAGGQWSRFDTPLRKTLQLLAREIAMVNGRSIVIELDVRERDIRLDGYPRADARPASPAVAVSFESKWGPLRYATNEFLAWQDNLRAIALSMEALRAVDRYGVSKRGEQYRGWRAIEAASQSVEDAIPDRLAAMEFLMQYGEPGEDVSAVVRRALFATHPDHGGSSEEFHKVARCKELVEGAGRLDT